MGKTVWKRKGWRRLKTRTCTSRLLDVLDLYGRPFTAYQIHTRLERHGWEYPYDTVTRSLDRLYDYGLVDRPHVDEVSKPWRSETTYELSGSALACQGDWVIVDADRRKTTGPVLDGPTRLS